MLFGCGGGGSGGDDNEGASTTPDSNRKTPTQLPIFNSHPLITDIVNLDLNKDGFQDLIMVRTLSDYRLGNLQALINNGDETFSDQTDKYLLAAEDTYFNWTDKIYLADLNNDGTEDLIAHHDQSHWNTSIGNNAVEMPPLLKSESDQFEFMTWSDLGAAGSLIPIDIDNDGDIDLMSHVFINFGTDQQQIRWTTHINNLIPSGEFSYTRSSNKIDTEEGADGPGFIYSPVIADLNADGFLDIFYTGPKWKDGGFVDELVPYVALINQQDGTFEEESLALFANAEKITHAREIHAADFNNDLVIDLLVSSHGFDGANFAGEKNVLLLGNAEQQFVTNTEKQTPFNYRGFTHSSDVGDIDNDGDIDIVFSDITGADVDHTGNIQSFFNDGEANFTRRSTANIQDDGGDMFIVSTKLVDLNNDGFLDLVLGGNDASSPAIVMWNDGEGNF
jgi:hypothetical protein